MLEEGQAAEGFGRFEVGGDTQALNPGTGPLWGVWTLLGSLNRKSVAV